MANITCTLSKKSRLKFITYTASKFKEIKILKQDNALKELMSLFTQMSEGDQLQYWAIAHQTLATVSNYHLFSNPQDATALKDRGLDPTSLYQKINELKTVEDIEALYKTPEVQDSVTDTEVTLEDKVKELESERRKELVYNSPEAAMKGFVSERNFNLLLGNKGASKVQVDGETHLVGEFLQLFQSSMHLLADAFPEDFGDIMKYFKKYGNNGNNFSISKKDFVRVTATLKKHKLNSRKDVYDKLMGLKKERAKVIDAKYDKLINNLKEENSPTQGSDVEVQVVVLNTEEDVASQDGSYNIPITKSTGNKAVLEIAKKGGFKYTFEQVKEIDNPKGFVNSLNITKQGNSYIASGSYAYNNKGSQYKVEIDKTIAEELIGQGKRIESKNRIYNGLKVVEVDKIINQDGKKGAAKYNRQNGTIEVNRKLLKQKFKEKAWTNPRELGDTIHPELVKAPATALKEDAFKTYQEWENFVIEHENQHHLYTRKEFENAKGKSHVSKYEDEINKRALEVLGITDAFVESTQTEEPITEAVAGIGKGLVSSLKKDILERLEYTGVAAKRTRAPKETDKQWNESKERLKKLAKEVNATFVFTGNTMGLTTQNPKEVLNSFGDNIDKVEAFIKEQGNQVKVLTEWLSGNTVALATTISGAITNIDSRKDGTIVFKLEKDATKEQKEIISQLGEIVKPPVRYAKEGMIYIATVPGTKKKVLLKDLRKPKGKPRKGILVEKGSMAKIIEFDGRPIEIQEIPITSDMNSVSLTEIGVKGDEIPKDIIKPIDIFLEERNIKDGSIYKQLEENGIIEIQC